MIPDIEVKIVFSDVQGVQYEEKGFIHTEKDGHLRGAIAGCNDSPQ